MKQETVMKAILGTLVLLVLLVGCQTARTISLPTPHMQQQEAPAALIDEPKPEKLDPVMETVMMFRTACLEKKSFWIRHKGKVEQYNCEIVNDQLN